MVNSILIVQLHTTNESVSSNCKSEGFGKQKSKYELSGASTKLTKVFTQSSGLFAQTLDLVVESTEKSIQSTNVLP